MGQRLFEDGWLAFCLLFEEIVEGSDVIVPVIYDVILCLCGVNTMSLHDAKKAFIDLYGILAHNDPTGHVIFGTSTVPLGLSNPFYRIAA